MPWKEKLFERRMRRPLDPELKQAVETEVGRRIHDLPVRSEAHWHATRPELTIKSHWLSLIVSFQDNLVVNAELSLAAKMMITDENRKQAVAMIESIADGLGL